MSNDKATKMTAKLAMNGIKRAVLYARVSSDDRGKEGRNLKGQLDMGREYAIAHDYRIVAELSEDDRGASGASFDLPQLGTVLAMAERGEFDVLVVRELDRLSRNLAKQLIVEESLKRNGVTVEYVLADYADTPEGNLQKHIRATVAEYEREKIKERMVRGKKNLAKGGRVILHGNKPPYGYRAVIEKSKDGKNIVTGIEVYEPEAQIVRLIFQWYTLGDETGKRLSLEKIAQRLSEMNVPTWVDVRNQKSLTKKRNYGQWAGGTIWDFLHCEVYIGKWYYGKQSSPIESCIKVPVPRVIDASAWQAAQEISKLNINVAKRNVKDDRYLMRYRLTCHCGYSATCISNDDGLKVRLYYRCSSMVAKVVHGKCGLPFFRADYLDELVWSWLVEWFKDPADLRRKLEVYQAERNKVDAPILALLKTNEDLIASNQAQLARIKDMCQTGILTFTEAVDRKARLEETIARLERERSELTKRVASKLSDEAIESLMEFSYDLAAGVAEASESFEKRRQMIEVLDVQGILKVENDEQICYASFILTEGVTRRLVLPKRGRNLSITVAVP